MLRRCDRYLLRETVGPFFLALAALVLFILLNIILSLSDLMVDRGVGMLDMLRLVAFKVPNLLIVAVPMSALFATFLGLGRMGHDREIVAYESLGIPLRRVLLPLLGAAALVTVVDFAVYNWVVPLSEAAYEQQLQDIIFREGIPRVTSNTFFRGQDGQVFYIRRYDEGTGRLYDVMVYDTTGRLFPQAGTRITQITATEGEWSGDGWTLYAGHVYGFDSEGRLAYSGAYDTLDIPLDQTVEQIMSYQLSPTQLSLGELQTVIRQAKQNGQNVAEYVVEKHLKLALPLATVVFTLFGGAISLAYGARSRASGIVVGLLVVGLFQGLLWWTQTLGRRGAMNPTLAAWLPDIAFGGLGVLLYINVDRLASRDIWSKIRSRIPFFSLLAMLILAGSLPGLAATEMPITLTCDRLAVSDDRRRYEADGTVSATFEGAILTADVLTLQQTDDSHWDLEATGTVSLVYGDDVRVSGDALAALIEIDKAAGSVYPRELKTMEFFGQLAFTNSQGEPHTLYFEGESAVFLFSPAGETERIEVFNSRMSTCNCCGVPLARQPYSLRTTRAVLYPDELIAAFGLTARVAGYRVFWLPLYVQPLEETLANPLFPAIGNSTLHGWFVKWNLPFFLSENTYGSLLVDVYTRYVEVALGGTLRYQGERQSGTVSVYAFPAKIGDSETVLSFAHSVDVAAGWRGTAALDFDRYGSSTTWSYAAELVGTMRDAVLSLEFSREQETDDQGAVVEQHLPRVSLELPKTAIGTVHVQPTFSAGWQQEWTAVGSVESAFRAVGRLSLEADSFSIAGFSFTPDAALKGIACNTETTWEAQGSASLSVSATSGPLRLTWTSVLVAGSTPFRSDHQDDHHTLDWRVDLQGAVGLRLSGSVNLADGLGPVDLRIMWGESVQWLVAAEVEPDDALVSSFSVRGTWAIDEDRSLSWSIPYDAEGLRFETATFDARFSTDQGTLTVSNKLDLNLHLLQSTDVELDLPLDSPWGLSISASYKPASSIRPLAIEYGVYYDIADCLRVGLERTRADVWVYASVLAFPEAVLRYAP